MSPPRERIELMSLPRRPTVKPDIGTGRSGLPINSLPGWEDIPLISKLPMLKCPGNEVIFSKNKIGQTFKITKYEFDLTISVMDHLPVYNPLQDNNMKSYYTTKENLKRLRKNGEITENNDVICNLKDFNQYRAELHKSNLYLMLQNQTKQEQDQKDIKTIEHADEIRVRAYGSLWAHKPDIIKKKQKLEEKKHQERLQAIVISDEKFAKANAFRKVQSMLLDYKKEVNRVNRDRHMETFTELKRKHLITIKKSIQSKSERSRKHMRLMCERREREEKERQTAAWERRLQERLEQQVRIRQLLHEAEQEKKIYINKYAAKFRDMWDRNEREIQQKNAEKMRIAMKKIKRKKANPKNYQRQSITQEYRETFEALHDSELCEALNAAINMENNVQVPFLPDDPIYKAATFIMTQIIAKFDKDLNCEIGLKNFVVQRLKEYFEDARRFVLFRASQIICAARNANKNDPISLGSINNLTCKGTHSVAKLVAFSNVSSTIGTSSYSIHPRIQLKSVGERQKTPPGSLTSILTDSLLSMVRTENLTRYDMVFVENFLIKFKKELVVGMGRRVFAAIRCHFHGRIMNVRQDLLDVNKKFLAEQGAEAILGYAKNSDNFNSVVRFCISSLSSKLIWSLQKILLKPPRDPRGIVQSTQGCPCDVKAGLCLFCGDCMAEGPKADILFAGTCKTDDNICEKEDIGSGEKC